MKFYKTLTFALILITVSIGLYSSTQTEQKSNNIEALVNSGEGGSSYICIDTETVN